MIKVKATNVHYLEDLKVSNKYTILNVKGAKLINKATNTLVYEAESLGDMIRYVRNNDYEGNEDELCVLIDNKDLLC